MPNFSSMSSHAHFRKIQNFWIRGLKRGKGGVLKKSNFIVNDVEEGGQCNQRQYKSEGN